MLFVNISIVLLKVLIKKNLIFIIILILPETLFTFNTPTLFTFKYFRILLNGSYPLFKPLIEISFLIFIIPGRKETPAEKPANIILLLKYKEFRNVFEALFIPLL